MLHVRHRTTDAMPLAQWTWTFCALIALLALAGCDAPRLSDAPHTPTQPAPSASATRAYYSHPTGTMTPSGASIPTGGAVIALDAGNGTLAWRRVIHTPLFQPTEVDGVVYATSYSDDPRASWLDAFDPQSGKLLWSHETPGTFNNPPVIVGGAIYVSAEQQAGSDFNGVLQALDEQSGVLRWEFPVAEAPSPAAVDGGVVYLSGMGSVLGTSALYALDAATGKARWSYTSSAQLSTLNPDRASTDAQLAPQVSDGVVAVISTIRDSRGFAIQSALALDAATGKPRWTHTTGGLLDAQLLAHGALFLAADIQTGNTSRSFVTAWRMSDGAVLWRQDARPGDTFFTGMAYVESQGAADGARLLVGEDTSARTGNTAVMVGLAPEDGRTLWTTPAGQQALGAPLLSGGLALVQVTVPAAGSRSALRVLALRPSDGHLRWSQAGGDSTAFGHAIWLVGDSVLSFVTTLSGSGATFTISTSILALRVSDGSRQWQVKQQ